MAATSEAIKAGIWSAFKIRLYEMPVHLYFLTWLPNLILQTLFYTLIALFAGGPTMAQFALVGNIVRLAALPTCIQTTYHLVADREEGYLTYLVTTPVNLAALLLGRSIFFSMEAILTVFIAAAILLPLAGILPTVAGFMLFSVVLAVICNSLSGLGLLVGSIVFRTRYDMVITSLVPQFLTIFCGVMIPLSMFPKWVARAVSFVPLTNGLAAVRNLLTGDLAGNSGLIAAELAVGTAYWILGFFILYCSVQYGRVRGSLERF